MTWDQPGRYTIWLQWRGKMQRWSYDLRSDKLAERTVTLSAEFPCDVPGPIHVVRAAAGLLLLDGAGGVHRIDDGEAAGLTKFGTLKPSSPRAQTMVVRDHDAGEVLILERQGGQLLPVDFLSAKPEFANPFATAIAPQKQAAILALLDAKPD